MGPRVSRDAFADGDLYFGDGNPFRQPFMPADCDDTDPAVGSCGGGGGKIEPTMQ